VTAPDIGVIIVAAGAGTRTGGAELKQFRWIAGKPMLLHSIQLFQERHDVAMVVAVLPREYAADPPPWIFQCDTDRLLVSVGGPERSDSVRNGLEDLDESCTLVVVHDAARPLVTAALAERVIHEARKGNCAVPGIPIADTVKRTNRDQRVVETVDRKGLWRAQTPQAFPRDVLERAYVEAGESGDAVTDDASLCERIGATVVIVPGSPRAMKITSDDDFAVAEALSILRE
jgi:2-C-methyl-D-erythritol 4-phosphate cytidylyltransferase